LEVVIERRKERQVRARQSRWVKLNKLLPSIINSPSNSCQVVLQTERPVTSQPVAEQFHVVNDAPQQEEVGMDMSGERMADESVPPSSPEQLEDLIDLHEEPAHQQLSQEEEVVLLMNKHFERNTIAGHEIHGCGGID
jgi:hypothetical protein